jgi:hypothetical protein
MRKKCIINLYLSLARTVKLLTTNKGWFPCLIVHVHFYFLFFLKANKEKGYKEGYFSLLIQMKEIIGEQPEILLSTKLEAAHHAK